MRWPALTCSLALALGCSKKSGGLPPEVSGLAAVPSTAEVVIAADVPRLAKSPLVQRAFDQLLQRDPDLTKSWQKLQQSCKLDLGQIQHVVLAIGPSVTRGGPQPGTGPVLVVATGKLAETELATCVRALVGQGGGSLNVKDSGGRSVYDAKDGNREVFFAFGRADTVVLGSSESFVVDAIGSGKKVLDNPDMKKWTELADQRAPLWAAGKVDERVRSGLARVTSGQLSAGPVALFLGFDPTTGAKASLGVVMANAQDAKTLESFANTQKGLLGYAAQAKSLGRLVDKITVVSDGTVVRFTADYTLDDVNQLVSALDGTGSAAQDSPPP